MDHRFLVLILCSLFIGEFGNVNGITVYKWIPFKSGDKIPSNAVPIESEGDVYVGRARHFDEILLAEINSTGSGVISSCHKEIPKEEFEILTTSGNCEWKNFDTKEDIDETLVRGGTSWDDEPIYIGTSIVQVNDIFGYSTNTQHILSIYLKNFELYEWKSQGNNYNSRYFKYLSCNLEKNWIDSSAVKLPNNTVYGGKSEEGYDIYVAKLKRYCKVYVGHAIPEVGTAIAKNDNDKYIEADFCQVLVGKPNEYTWVSASDGEIPDYAVTNDRREELSYVVRLQLTHSYAKYYHLDYDVLVENIFV